MNQNHILWQQKANSNSSTLRNFGYFLYEFVGARFTVLAFLGLFNFAAYYLDFFGQFLSIGITIFLYYIISDAFSVFWTGVNLEYFVEDDKIVFRWGVFRNHELVVPFDKITKISALYSDNQKRSAIIFENSDNIKNGDYGFSKEIYFDQLSFENVVDIKNLVSVLHESYGKIKTLQDAYRIEWKERLPTSSLYLKFLQLCAFIFLYASTSVGLRIIDNNILTSNLVQDVVIKQDKKFIGHYQSSIIETKEGYSFELTRHRDYQGELVSFYVSPLFKDVTSFESYKSPNYETLESAYRGFNIVIKIIAIITMILSSSFIFYKRGRIPFAELTMILLFPIAMCIIAFLIFNKY
jgi:hypothetical protein